MSKTHPITALSPISYYTNVKRCLSSFIALRNDVSLGKAAAYSKMGIDEKARLWYTGTCAFKKSADSSFVPSCR
jgi:hypothetical protein